MKIAITGHRPEKIVDEEHVRHLLRTHFREKEPSQVIVGMAAGVDLWAGEEALALHIPVVAARPWVTHTPRVQDEISYRRILENASRVVIVEDTVTYPGPRVYHNRNHWMVDESDLLLGVWDGAEGGGTYECLQYALRKDKHVVMLDPSSRKWAEYNKPVPPLQDLFSWNDR